MESERDQYMRDSHIPLGKSFIVRSQSMSTRLYSDFAWGPRDWRDDFQARTAQSTFKGGCLGMKISRVPWFLMNIGNTIYIYISRILILGIYDHLGVFGADEVLEKNNFIRGPYPISCSGYCRIYVVTFGWWKAKVNTKSYLDGIK